MCFTCIPLSTTSRHLDKRAAWSKHRGGPWSDSDCPSYCPFLLFFDLNGKRHEVKERCSNRGAKNTADVIDVGLLW